MQCLLFIYMETTTDTKSTVTLPVRANSQLQNSFSTHSPSLAIHFHQWGTRSCMPCLSNLHQWRWSTVAVTTAEMHHPSPHCATFIVCSPEVFSKHQCILVGAIFFCMGEFNSTPLCYMHFHVRCHSVRLPFYCSLSHSNKMGRNVGWKFQPLLP